MQQFYKFITLRFVSLNMFRALPRPSSGAYNCINSLWFYLLSQEIQGDPREHDFFKINSTQLFFK
jgi:hypothetical protein